MDLRVARLIGILLLAAGFAVLVLAPPGFSPVHLFGGLALLIASVPFLVGAIGTPPHVARARAAAARQLRCVPADEVPARVFRRRVAWGGTDWVFYNLAAGLAVASVVLGLALWRNGLVALLAIVVPTAGMAAFLVWYAWTYSSLWVQVGPHGVSARQYLRTVSMRWDQVVALTSTDTIRGLRTYAIWSERDRISFYAGGLDGAEQLAAVIADVTGPDVGRRPARTAA